MIAGPTKGKGTVVSAPLALALFVSLNALAAAADMTGLRKAPAPSKTMSTAPMKGNGSGVIVQYRVDGTPVTGVAVPVVLAFGGVTQQSGAVVKLTTEGGLRLPGGEEVRTLPAGEVTSLTVNVTPAAAGIGYLHVFTTQHGSTSATSIPIQTRASPSALPHAGELKQTPGGEPVRSYRVK